MKTRIYFLLSVLLILGISSCKKSMFIRGNNSMTTVERDLTEFDKVANDGSFEVIIINDENHYVQIQAESNLIPHISTLVYNGALIIDSKENLLNRQPMTIEVHISQLRAIELNGSGSIHTDSFINQEFSAVLDGSGNIFTQISGANDSYFKVSGSGNMDVQLETDVLTAIVDGSGDLKISGEGKSSSMKVQGSGNIRAKDFRQESSSVINDGSGQIYLYVSNYLNAKILGSGSIYYSGNPTQLDQWVDGSGRIIKQ